MNFDCVGKNSKGQMYMKFHKPFNTVEKMNLLERSLLVNLFAYNDFYDSDEHAISGFDLLERVRSTDNELYIRIQEDATLALKLQYELNDNILSDYQYDANAIQLEELVKANPEEFKRSRYYTYFKEKIYGRNKC